MVFLAESQINIRERTLFNSFKQYYLPGITPSRPVEMVLKGASSILRIKAVAGREIAQKLIEINKTTALITLQE
ncbi:MAG: hypothetical protein N3E45_10935 [Oscillatoriaceae bacterium SKW80]|nr:hypothetical protein [Oscillatoriaceae bacterium SKYG93]MCX8121327.1 hypothetical protein [Oscillatoriaceae bacterium SKW80]MDW8453339.1 hypothetical protein [Oscillatoriaceae cyanobacterium SKYGB_i_bin93]HIK26693.1 hypothetical protein [Oscillatoriaceae cyanobacterium M7585_C2015_266]